MTVGSRHEELSTGVESKSQIPVNNAIKKRRLVLLAKGRGLRDPSCSIADRSRFLMAQNFDEDNALGYLWNFPVIYPHLILTAPCFRIVD